MAHFHWNQTMDEQIQRLERLAITSDATTSAAAKVMKEELEQLFVKSGNIWLSRWNEEKLPVMQGRGWSRRDG